MKLNSKKVFYILVGVLVLILIASITATIYGTSMLEKTGDTLLERKLENTALSKDEKSLAQAKRDIEKYKELEHVAKSIVPQEKDQARTVRELVSLAQQSGIQIETISFPASDLGQTKKPAKGQKAAPAGTTQLTPVEGLSGVYAMPIDVQVSSEAPVTYNQVLRFLEKLEQNRRTSHVTDLTISPSEENRNIVTFSLQINAYIKP